MLVIGFAVSPVLAAPADVDRAVVNGRVVAADGGVAVAGARVRIVPGAGSGRSLWQRWVRTTGGEVDAMEPLAEAVSGSDGAYRFELEGAPLATLRGDCDYDVTVTRDGFVPASRPLRHLAPPGRCERDVDAEEISVVDLPTVGLPTAERVLVRVRQPDGEPAAGAWLLAEERSGEPGSALGLGGGWRVEQRIVPTNEKGVVHLERIAGRALWLSAHRPGDGPVEAVLDVEYAEAELTLAPTSVQTLKVLSPRGDPLGDSWVLMHPGPWPVAMVPSRGVVEIRRPAAETLVSFHRVSAEPFRLPPRSFDGDDYLLVDLGAPRDGPDLDAAPSLVGRVVSETGDAIPFAEIYQVKTTGARISALNGRPRVEEDAWTLADSDGAFRLPMPADSSRGPTTVALEAFGDGHLHRRLDHVQRNVATGGQLVGAPIDIVLRRDLTLRGVVRSSTGAPVVGAQLSISDPSSLGLGTQTSYSMLDGVFEIGEIDPEIGGQQLEVFHVDHAPQELPLSELPEPPAEIEIVLEPAVTLRGLVVDQDGEAVPHASVSILRPESSRFSRLDLMAGTGSSDADGEFEMYAVPYGPLELVVSHSEFRRHVVQTNVSEASAHSRLDIELESKETFTVSGRLVGGLDDLGGLRVSLAQRTGGTTVGGTLGAETSPDGEFSIDGVEAGLYWVGVSDAAGRRQLPSVEKSVLVEGPTEVEIELPQTATIEGRLLGLSPEQLAQVTLSHDGRVDAESATYRITGLLPGVYQVTGSVAYDSPWARAEVVVEDGHDHVADLDFTSARYSIRGLVSVDDRPAPDVGIYLFPRPHHRDDVRTDAEGRFEIPDLATGSYRLRAIYGSRRDSLVHEQNLHISSDRYLEIELAPDETFTLRCRVDGEEGPLADVRIQPIHTDNGAPRYRDVVYTDRRGEIELRDLPAGAWRLELSKSGYGSRVERFEVDDDHRLEVKMEPSEVLVFRVLGVRGRPLARAQARLVDDGGTVLTSAELIADGDGWMRLDTAPEGRWRLWVQGEGLVATTDVEVPGPPLELTAQGESRLRLVVAEFFDSTITHGELEILDEIGRTLFRRTVRLRNGHEEIHSLPPGRLTLRLTADGRTWQQQVHVSAGTHQDLVLGSP